MYEAGKIVSKLIAMFQDRKMWQLRKQSIFIHAIFNNRQFKMRIQIRCQIKVNSPIDEATHRNDKRPWYEHKHTKKAQD